MKFKTLTTKYLSQHKYFTARQDSYETPTGKIVDPYFVVEMPESACAVALTAENKVVLIEQYRYPVNRETIELPGGFIDKNEDPERAVARELAEETGYSFESFYFLGKTYANPGVLDNGTNLFLARGGKKTCEQSLDPNEEIKILFYPLEEVRKMLAEGKFIQSLHEVCLRRAFEYLENLKTL